MPDAEPELERRFLGMVEVDSGTLIVGDPAYCLPRVANGKPGIDYQAVIEAPDEPASSLGGQPVLLIGRFGGDGIYPVVGELDEYGELVRLTIEFLGPADEGDGEEPE